MHRNRPSPADPERGFRVFQNKAGKELFRGESVCYLTPNEPGAGTTPNGVIVGIPSSAERGVCLIAGVCFDDSIQEGAWGRFQVSGYCDYALVQQNLSGVVSIGNPLGVGTSSTTLTEILTSLTLTLFQGRVTAMANIPAGVNTAAYPVMLSCS